MDWYRRLQVNTRTGSVRQIDGPPTPDNSPWRDIVEEDVEIAEEVGIRTYLAGEGSAVHYRPGTVSIDGERAFSPEDAEAAESDDRVWRDARLQVRMTTDEAHVMNLARPTTIRGATSASWYGPTGTLRSRDAATYYTFSRNSEHKRVEKSFWDLSQVEAIYAFMTWMSSIKGGIVVGTEGDSRDLVALIQKFTEANNLPMQVRRGYCEHYVSPPTTLEELGLVVDDSGLDFFTRDDSEGNDRIMINAAEEEDVPDMVRDE